MMWRLILCLVIVIAFFSPAVIAAPGDDTFTEEEIGMLITSLADESADVRKEAAEDLARAGTDAASAIPALIHALSDEDWEVSEAAASALYCIGDESIPHLHNSLIHENPHVRGMSLYVLAHLESSDITLRLIREAFDDEEFFVRRKALDAAASMGENARSLIPDIYRVLQWDDTPTVRYSAVRALGQIGSGSDEVISMLIELLDDNELRSSVRDVLQEIGYETVPCLIEAIDSEISSEKIAAISVLGDMGKTAAEAVPRLIDALMDPDPDARNYAASALGKIGPVTPEVIPALIKAVETGSDELFSKAADALRMIGPDASDAIDVLVDAMNTRSPAFADDAVRAIGGIGTTDPEVIDELIGILDRYAKDTPPYGSLKGIAIYTLGEIGPPANAVVPRFLDMLADDEYKQKAAAIINALAKIGMYEPGVKEAFIEALDHSLDRVRTEALTALLQYDQEELRKHMRIVIDGLPDADFQAFCAMEDLMPFFGADAVPYLVEKARNAELEEKYCYFRVLAMIGPDAREAIPFLLECLESEHERISQNAARVIGAIGPEAAKAIPQLIHKLETEGDPLGIFAYALGEMGPLAKDAVPLIIELAETKRLNLTSAINALVNIGPEPGVVEFLLVQVEQAGT